MQRLHRNLDRLLVQVQRAYETVRACLKGVLGEKTG